VQCTLVISGIHKSLATRRVNAYAHMYTRPLRVCVRPLQTPGLRHTRLRLFSPQPPPPLLAATAHRVNEYTCNAYVARHSSSSLRETIFRFRSPLFKFTHEDRKKYSPSGKSKIEMRVKSTNCTLFDFITFRIFSRSCY